MKIKHNLTKKQSRTRRVRARVKGTVERPRLHVYRSNKYLYAQIIDDVKGTTLAAATETKLTKAKGTKTQRAKILGEFIAKKATAKKIAKVIFDRGPNRYHGRIKAFAQAARENGLNF
jgi:large subunit ribosomal protein L18